jgi:hypothetical protein
MSSSSSSTLERLLTRERLRSYLIATHGDHQRALALYEWNLLASAAVLHTTGIVEVIVRNALDLQLVHWTNRHQQGDWFEVIPLDPRGRADVARAIRRSSRNPSAPIIHGKVVAELNFGFWRYLTARRYFSTLWLPALHEAFPFGPENHRARQRAVHHNLEGLTLLRNRAAHHEPIHRRDLAGDLTRAIQTVSWINPLAGDWIECTSIIPGVLAERPRD